jgi:hypothetical protein
MNSQQYSFMLKSNGLAIMAISFTFVMIAIIRSEFNPSILANTVESWVLLIFAVPVLFVGWTMFGEGNKEALK